MYRLKILFEGAVLSARFLAQFWQSLYLQAQSKEQKSIPISRGDSVAVLLFELRMDRKDDVIMYHIPAMLDRYIVHKVRRVCNDTL